MAHPETPPTPAHAPEEEEKPLDIFAEVKALEEAEREEEVREHLPNLLKYMDEEVGITLAPDISGLYEEMDVERELVRIENLSRIVESLSRHTPIKLGGTGDHYANAVLPDQEGLRIAFGESRALGPVRLLIGFDIRPAIGFNPEGLTVRDVLVEEEDPRDAADRAAHTRHVEGNLMPEHIHHIILRVPFNYFPESQLSAEEKGTKPRFIFRGNRITTETLPLTVQEKLELQRTLIERSPFKPLGWIDRYGEAFYEMVRNDPSLRLLTRTNKKAALAVISRRLQKGDESQEAA